MIDATDKPHFSFSEKEQIARTTVLVLIKARTEDDEPFYAYAAVMADKLENLKRVQGSGKPYRLQDYGKILAAGLGEPPEETRRHMEEHYGFDHERSITLED